MLTDNSEALIKKHVYELWGRLGYPGPSCNEATVPLLYWCLFIPNFESLELNTMLYIAVKMTKTLFNTWILAKIAEMLVKSFFLINIILLKLGSYDLELHQLWNPNTLFFPIWRFDLSCDLKFDLTICSKSVATSTRTWVFFHFCFEKKKKKKIPSTRAVFRPHVNATNKVKCC